MVTLRFSLVCWASWASFVLSTPVNPSRRQAPSPPMAALPGAPGPAPVVPLNAPVMPDPDASQPAYAPSAAPYDYRGREPCAVASEMIAPQLPANAEDAENAPLPTLPAQVGWDCIQSVPLNKSAALALMDSVEPYLQWQSNLAFLKNPPTEYVNKIQKPTDTLGMFQTIRDNLNNDMYPNEYSFGMDLYNVSAASHDGHFDYIPDSVGLVFAWARPVPLVSISEDGGKTPAPFAYQDVLQASFRNQTYDPSRIMKINGVEATTFLENESQIGSLQDRDALYNNMFYSLPQVSLFGQGSGRGMFAGGGNGRFIYPGPQTTLEFANGTTKTYENIARAIVNMTDVTDGTSLYQKYFATPPMQDLKIDFLNDPLQEMTSTSTSAPATSSTSMPSTTMAAPGYPTPVVRHSENLNGGYYIDEEGYEDVAVLTVASFVGDSTQQEFQDVNTKFIKQAVADGKKKMIVDLSANGGGTIIEGYDLFKQFFPQMQPYGANRLRAHEGANMLGQIYTEASKGVERSLSLGDDNILNVILSVFNAGQDIDANSNEFKDWDDKYNPREYNNDNFTGTIRWDLDDPLITLNSGGIEVTGFGNRTGFEQPFAPENIVMVYDGYCASTCTLFSDFMRQQAGIKTIAYGGRSNRDIIQPVGGVKGANNFGWPTIQGFSQIAFNYSSMEDRQNMLDTELGKLDNMVYLSRAAVSPGVNVRDALRRGDRTGTPTHFQYEPGECRIYYTADMTVDMTAMWKTAYDSMWGNKNHCVAGGLRQGTIGQFATMKSKGQKRDVGLEKREEEMTKNFAMVMPETKLAVDQINSLMGTLDTFTNSGNKLWSAQGLMRA